MEIFKKIVFHILSWPSILSVALSCASGMRGSENNSDLLDSAYVEMNQTSGSSIILIVSPVGKVIKEISYAMNHKNFEYYNYIKGYPKSNTIEGDFDGNGISEKIWKEADYEKYLICQEEGDTNSCKGIFNSSNNNISSLEVNYCPLFTFKNEGDLNEDGKDEIGILPGWFSSGCRQYQVYTYNQGEWSMICEPIQNSYNMREAGIILIEKSKEERGSVVIRQSLESYIFDNPDHNIPADYYTGSSCARSNVLERILKLN